ncbi:hypothetical protein LX36DRAFT_698957 [Colletotrichum falcatum]|nr:hypothetical protein LX36DRAFT_698957 [Colletotrichum falcatum]
MSDARSFLSLALKGSSFLPQGNTNSWNMNPKPALMDSYPKAMTPALRNSRRLLSMMPCPIRNSPLRLPFPGAIQRRGLSASPVPRASIIHPDTDTFIKYSLTHGPPQTPRVKSYRTNLKARPPKMGAAAIEHRVLDEVARHISSHHHSPCRKAVNHANASSPVFDFVGTGPGPSPMANHTGISESKTAGSTSKTAACYYTIPAVVAASALVGYLTCWWTSTSSVESGGSE